MNKRSYGDRQRGLSLVELMISITIGLILIAGVAQIFMSGRQSFNTQSGMGSLQENGRFALRFLQKGLELSGFPRTTGPAGGNPPVAPFVTDTADADPALANVVVSSTTITADSGGTASDSIMIRYNSDPSVPDSDLDCLGNRSTVLASGSCTTGTNSGDAATNQAGSCSWSVVNSFFVEDNQLMCDGNGGTTGSATPKQPIVSGVENMQILYGEDTDGDEFASANVFRTASAIANWANVTAIRIALLVNSSSGASAIPTDAIRETIDDTEYAILEQTTTPADDTSTPNVDERRLGRRVFVITIELRNRTL
jgi:type IV pilus assembly protein PilW